jgi:alkylation response protein AidB-like acyl-CoA dehydrogenase
VKPSANEQGFEFVECDLNLTDEQEAIRSTARRFATEVLRPVGIELDRLAPEAVTAKGSPLFRVLAQAAELGFMRLGGPAVLGGLEAPPLTRHLVLEEFAAGNAGLAGVIFLASFPAEASLVTGDQDLIGEFAAPYYAAGDGSIIGCWAITEPDHGSDMLGTMRPELRVKRRGQLRARRAGDGWVLNGQKSAWVSNGPIATHGVFNVQLEAQDDRDRGGVCVVALDLPGVSRGRPLDKHGVRSLPQGEIFFDEVKIPRRWMIVEDQGYPEHVETTLTAFNASVGALATGLARSAFEAALKYAKERVQGGKPIFEHQSVRARLFRMFSLVRAARAMSREVLVYNLTRLAAGKPGRLDLSIASKVFCTDAALEVATLAVQLHGGNGMTRQYPVEMLLRDATAFTIADGENAFLAQVAASML